MLREKAATKYEREARVREVGYPAYVTSAGWLGYSDEKIARLTKEAVAALRARQKALDARPIKKVAEAKARKKYKAMQRMVKAQKKAEDVLANEDGEMTQRDKAKSIAKVLAKGGAKAKRKETQLVVAKGPNRGLKGRPKGVKGRFKMVDGRMKKELRAQKRIDKRDGKKRGGNAGGRSKQKPRVPNGYGGR